MEMETVIQYTVKTRLIWSIDGKLNNKPDILRNTQYFNTRPIPGYNTDHSLMSIYYGGSTMDAVI